MKSCTAFISSSMFSILLIASGVPSFLSKLTIPTLFRTSFKISNAFKFSFEIWKLLIMLKKSNNFSFVPLLTLIS